MFFRLCLCSFILFSAVKGEPLKGSTDANEGDYPFAVSVRYRGSHVCSGAIVNNRWVLTAAHCLENEPNVYREAEYMSIHTGNILKADSPRYDVDELVRLYSHDPYGYDLALLHVTRKIEPQPGKVEIIKMAIQQMIHPGDHINIAAWGSNGDFTNGHAIPRKQQVIDSTVLRDDVCDRDWSSRGAGTLFCTISTPPSGTNAGDSGAPLVVANVHGTKYLVGIHIRNAAMHNGRLLPRTCCDGRAAIHIKVIKFRDWVHSVID